MKAKRLFLAIAAPLAAGGLWLAQSAWRAHRQLVSQNSSMGAGFKISSTPDSTPSSRTFQRPSMGAGSKMPRGRPKPGQRLNSPARLRPPNPNRLFEDFTPEQRVQFARQGHGPGG